MAADREIVPEFAAAIEAAVIRHAPLDELAGTVTAFKSRGLSQDEAVHVLEQQRRGVDEDAEDRILELLDRVWGWCSPHARLFP